MPRPLPSERVHRHNLLRAALRSGAIIFGSLAVGVLGLRVTEGTPWIDALLGAAMILTGMGPTGEMQTTAGKLFLSGYALFSGVVFLGAVALLFHPIYERILHQFHLELEE